MTQTVVQRLETLQAEVAQAQDLLGRAQEVVDRVQVALGTAEEVVVQTRRWTPRVLLVVGAVGLAVAAAVVVRRRRRARPT